jgi:hypothetical protein
MTTGNQSLLFLARPLSGSAKESKRSELSKLEIFHQSTRSPGRHSDEQTDEEHNMNLGRFQAWLVASNSETISLTSLPSALPLS